MKFSGKEDIEAPIGAVFAMLSEFESFERSAIRRGIEVQRSTGHGAPAAGLEWDARFVLRGRPRDLHVTLTRYQAPALMRFESVSKGMRGLAEVELLALSPRRTRLTFDLTLNAQTLTARLFLQSLKLSRKNFMRRFRAKLAGFARQLEERHRRRLTGTGSS